MSRGAAAGSDLGGFDEKLAARLGRVGGHVHGTGARHQPGSYTCSLFSLGDRDKDVLKDIMLTGGL